MSDFIRQFDCKINITKSINGPKYKLFAKKNNLDFSDEGRSSTQLQPNIDSIFDISDAFRELQMQQQKRIFNLLQIGNEEEYNFVDETSP